MVTAEPIERASELGLITAAARSAAAGEAGLVSIVGEAGIGKTTFIQMIRSTLSTSGFSVLHAALSEVEQHLSWAGLRVLCADISNDEFDHLPAANRSAIPAAIGRTEASDIDATRVAFALADLFSARSSRQPLAVVIDDLHWLDRATAGALALALRLAAGTPLLVVLGHRPVDVPIDPDRLLASERTVVVELPGLSVAGLHQLLRERCNVTLGRPDLVRIHTATGGHPLHAIEVGRQIKAGASLDEALVHPSAYAAISARIHTLPLACRNVLLIAALAIVPSVEIIARVLPDIDVEAELDVAIKQQLVTVRGSAMQFTHPLVRAAVVADAGPGERRRIRTALAGVSEDEDERVALRVAASTGPDAGLADAVDAAVERAVSRDDPQLALDLARRAVELTPTVDRHLVTDRLLTAAELAMSSGDLIAPVEFVDRVDLLTDDIEARFRAGVIRLLTLGNRGDEQAGLSASEALLTTLAGHPSKLARIHDIRAQILLRTDVGMALAEAEQALTSAGAGGDADQITRAEALLTMVRVMAGEPVDLDAVEASARAMPVTSVARDWLADALSFCERSAAALEISLAQLVEYRRLGAVHFEAPVRLRIAGDLMSLGRYDEAIRGYSDWFDLQSMIQGVPAAAAYADRACALAIIGRDADARAGLLRLDNEPSTVTDLVGVWSRVCQIRGLWSEWPEAAEAGRRAGAVARQVGVRVLGAAPFRPFAVEALVHVGALAEAVAMTEELEQIVARSGEPRGAPDVDRCRALLATAEGDIPTAVERWRAAVEGYERVDTPLDASIALLGLGSALRRANRRSEAGAVLQQACDRFGALGTPPYQAQALAELDRLGVRRTTNALDLTPTEQQIAEHVVAGRSNAEIASAMSISLRTVESNLTKVYRKLAVRSRTELAAAWRQRR